MSAMRLEINSLSLGATMAVQLKRKRKSEGNITDVHSQVSFDSLYPSNTVTKTLLILYVNHSI